MAHSLPTEPGYYWHRRLPDGKWRVDQVCNGAGWLFVVCEGRQISLDNLLDHEWSLRIPEPAPDPAGWDGFKAAAKLLSIASEHLADPNLTAEAMELVNHATEDPENLTCLDFTRALKEVCNWTDVDIEEVLRELGMMSLETINA